MSSSSCKGSKKNNMPPFQTTVSRRVLELNPKVSHVHGLLDPKGGTWHEPGSVGSWEPWEPDTFASHPIIFHWMMWRNLIGVHFARFFFLLFLRAWVKTLRLKWTPVRFAPRQQSVPHIYKSLSKLMFVEEKDANLLPIIAQEKFKSNHL